MSPEKDALLCAAFPKLYGDRHGDMRTTAMCWGFSCGDGWFQIIYDLSEKITAFLKRMDEERGCTESTLTTKEPMTAASDAFRATQVKEKFGTLRFYTNYHTEEIGALIDEAVKLSAITCEDCGKPGVLRHQHRIGGNIEHDRHAGWLFTACEEHSRDGCPPYGCYVKPGESRVCEKSTRSCIVDHTAEEAEDNDEG